MDVPRSYEKVKTVYYAINLMRYSLTSIQKHAPNVQ